MRVCGLCGTEKVTVVLELEDRTGRSFALPGEIQIGEFCRLLIKLRDAATLSSRLSGGYEDVGRQEVAAYVVEAFAATRPWSERKSTIEGERLGFVPLSDHTGAVSELGPLWPEADRLSRADLGDAVVDPDDAWLVRSPFPRMAVVNVLGNLWRFVERQPYPDGPIDRERRIREYFESEIGPEVITFDALIDLLVAGAARPAFHGVFRDLGSRETPVEMRVWWRGRLARIEEPPGTLVLIAGEDTYWRKGPSDPDVVELPRSRDHDDFEMSALTMLDPDRYWREWLGQDRPLVERTLRSTVVHGRRAWEFTAPWVKGGASEVAVDAELGIVLRSHRDDVGVFQSWTEVSTDVELRDQLFEYDGTWG